LNDYFGLGSEDVIWQWHWYIPQNEAEKARSWLSA